MKPIARLNYDLYVRCPACGIEFDLIENNDVDSRISIPLFNNQWGDLGGLEVVCDRCNHEFKIEKVEY